MIKYILPYFRYTDPGSSIGQAQDGDFETYLKGKAAGQSNNYYLLAKTILTNVNYNISIDRND